MKKCFKDWSQSSLCLKYIPVKRLAASHHNEYDQEIPQSHTADQPTAPLGRATTHKQSHDIRKTIKVKQLITKVKQPAIKVKQQAMKVKQPAIKVKQQAIKVKQLAIKVKQ